MNRRTPHQADLIEKAGALILRTAPRGERQVYLVHRPRYDDWSVPKGHIDRGETPLQAALREAGEETGMFCAVDRPLPPYYYQLPNGTHVLVHMFALRSLDAGQPQDDEVDRGEWLAPSDAAARVSYPSLGSYLREVAGFAWGSGR
jgi:8-oxo-dGTP diphosphatase